MFITVLVLLFIIKLRFPKGKYIHQIIQENLLLLHALDFLLNFIPKRGFYLALIRSRNFVRNGK